MRNKRESLTKRAYFIAKEIVDFKLRELNDKEYNVQFREIIDKEYWKQVCNLPTEDLDSIVYEHNSGWIKKDPGLIEVIINELTERLILGKRG